MHFPMIKIILRKLYSTGWKEERDSVCMKNLVTFHYQERIFFASEQSMRLSIEQDYQGYDSSAGHRMEDKTGGEAFQFVCQEGKEYPAWEGKDTFRKGFSDVDECKGNTVQEANKKNILIDAKPVFDKLAPRFPFSGGFCGFNF